jgi:lipopolysaccharide export system protein LptC
MISLLRAVWDRASLYLPIVLMGLLALGTYWLVRSTPELQPPEAPRAPTHEPDYFMKGFTARGFDVAGRLRSEITGVLAQHYPDTNLLEIETVRIRSFSENGRLTTATANRAITNVDATDVKLIGNALVVREAVVGPQPTPRLEFRGEVLYALTKTEQFSSDQPVTLIRGGDRFVGDAMAYDNLKQVIELKGRVKGTLTPEPAK